MLEQSQIELRWEFRKLTVQLSNYSYHVEGQVKILFHSLFYMVCLAEIREKDRMKACKF